MSDNAKPREWHIFLEQDANGALLVREFRDRVREAMLEMEVVGDKIGGFFVVVPDREELEPGVYLTVAYHYRWQSFVPQESRKPAPAEPEPVLDEEPELDGATA